MRSLSNCCLSHVFAQLALLLVALNFASSEDVPSGKTAHVNRQKRSQVSGADILAQERRSAKALLGDLSALKRAPGWGKRFSEMVPDSNVLDDNEWDPLDGEVDQEERFLAASLLDDALENSRASKSSSNWQKRAPGWGKRAPGWGNGKRAPGWGKRAPGWGKRAPGWGKRSSDDDICLKLDADLEIVAQKAQSIEAQRMEAMCGNRRNTNELHRK